MKVGMVMTVDGVDHLILHRKTDCDGMRETVVSAPIGDSSSGFAVMSKITKDSANVMRNIYYTQSIYSAFAKFEEWIAKAI